MTQHATEIAKGDRFEFGKNWAQYLPVIDDQRIAAAERSLRDALGRDRLDGLTFLDIGSGSGLFSLAARRLGAQVRSVDYDPHSVACTKALKRQHFPNDAQWVVQEGSVLDGAFVQSLGRHDIVYSWGVLHHTGAMWHALDHVTQAVAPNGQLLISIYNDQGTVSRAWTRIKRLYNLAPQPVKLLMLIPSFFYVWSIPLALDVVRGRPLASWRDDYDRGMSPWRDLVDWVGGYPFEVAKPEDIFRFYRVRGFHLQNLKTCRGGRGCNEFTFVKAASQP